MELKTLLVEIEKRIESSRDCDLLNAENIKYLESLKTSPSGKFLKDIGNEGCGYLYDNLSLYYRNSEFSIVYKLIANGDTFESAIEKRIGVQLDLVKQNLENRVKLEKLRDKIIENLH